MMKSRDDGQLSQGRAKRLGAGLAISLLPLLLLALMAFGNQARAEVPIPPSSLKLIPVPEPPNLLEYVEDRQAAIKLGKAFYWDMQVGGDGSTACATCHYHAGVDNREKNQVNPGGDSTFQVGRPNYALSHDDFPFHQRQAPVDRQSSAVVRDSNDVAGSQGVRPAQFVDISGTPVDNCTPSDDPVFNVGGVETRQTTGRNAPSVVNAVFNFANFWDGRANNIFNGVSPFGPSDLNARILVNQSGLQAVEARITNASLASQAVGPPNNAVEMSCAGRTFPKLGKKMLSLPPLGQQLVHPNDSVLGGLSKASLDANGRAFADKGLQTTYSDMIKAAFKSKYWDNTTQIVKFQDGVPTFLAHPGRALQTDEFTQMEANFSLFWGLAVQLYESTLVSNDSLFDRVREGRASFTPRQQTGLNLFLNQGKCINCHVGAEFTGASVRNQIPQGPEDHGVIERMFMAFGPEAIYDNGFYNAAVTRTSADRGRGGTDPLSFPLSFSRLAQMKARGQLPAGLAAFVPDLPLGVTSDFRVAVDGAFKTPGLRNVELTGPYFHNGGAATLEQVVDLYARGSNFPQANAQDLDADHRELPAFQGNPETKGSLVEFLLTLTDERVRGESAPFDHPQLFIPNGAQDSDPSQDVLEEIPAVGAAGRAAQGLPHLERFLGGNRAPLAVGDTVFTPQGSASRPISVLANDSDLDGDIITIGAVGQTPNGTVAVGTDRATISYTPNPSFAGTDVFTYTITSAGPFSVTTSVTVTVHAANAAPTPISDTASVPSVPLDVTGEPIDVLANDGDPNNDILTVSAVTQGERGTVAVGTGGRNVLYTPGPLFSGDSFTYTVSDGVLTATATVTLTVNLPPEVRNDTATVPQDSSNNPINVLANDSDPNGSPVTIASVTPPSNGRVSIAAGGTHILYTPNPGFFGGDPFVYTVSDGRLFADAIASITVQPSNRAPLAGPNAISVPQNSANNLLDVLANDVDFDGNPLTIIATTQPFNGSVTIGPRGANLSYTPASGFVGPDPFTYTVSDGLLTATATVTVTVNRPPLAVGDAIIIPVNSANNRIDVLANDSDPDGNPIFVASVAQPPGGSAAVGPQGASVLYTPSSGFGGADTLVYTISDGALTATATVSITVNRPPLARNDGFTVPQDSIDNPLNVLANDADPDGNPVSLVAASQPTNGSRSFGPGSTIILYTPSPGFVGADSFTYSVSDGLFTTTATVDVTVQRSNRLPIARADQATVVANSAHNFIDLLANDSDPDGNPIRIIAVTQGASGAVSIAPGSTGVFYLPTPGFVGEDTFTYTLSDGFLTSTGTVTVTIHRENHRPAAASFTVTIDRDSSRNLIDALARASDPDGDLVRIIETSKAASGTVAIAPGGLSIEYTPRLGFIGIDSFAYLVSDGVLTATATITVDVIRPLESATRVYFPLVLKGQLKDGW